MAFYAPSLHVLRVLHSKKLLCIIIHIHSYYNALKTPLVHSIAVILASSQTGSQIDTSGISIGVDKVLKVMGQHLNTNPGHFSTSPIILYYGSNACCGPPDCSYID